MIPGKIMQCSSAMGRLVSYDLFEFPLEFYPVSLGNRIERCLSYDEKPLLLFQKLKDAKKNPVFMLKHIKDIRSPIAVAQQKHAARKASSVVSQEISVTDATVGHQKTASTSRTAHRPAKLEVQDFSTPMMSASSSLHPGWPEGNASLAGDQDTMIPGSATTQTTHFSTCSTTTSSTLVGTSSNGPPKPGNADTGGVSATRETPVPSNGVSYAVAIYPYMAEQDDEFDVVV
jgi:bZIP factor